MEQTVIGFRDGDRDGGNALCTRDKTIVSMHVSGLDHV